MCTDHEVYVFYQCRLLLYSNKVSLEKAKDRRYPEALGFKNVVVVPDTKSSDELLALDRERI